MNLSGITGANVPDVFNLEPYGCARRLYFQKTGEKAIDPCSVDDERSRKARLTIYTPFVFNVYQKTTKRSCRVPNPKIFINHRYPFIIGDPDFLQTNLKAGQGKYVPLEIRILDRVSFYDIRKNGLPDRYYNFMLHHLMIAKQSTWASVAFFCPDVMEMKVSDITYDMTIAAEVVKAEELFWKSAQDNMPPPVGIEKSICRICGYRHKCYVNSEIWTKNNKEELELTETVNLINIYLKGK